MGRGSNVNQEIITVIQCSEHCIKTLLDSFIHGILHRERAAYILLVCKAGGHYHQGDHSQEDHLGVRHPLHLEVCHDDGDVFDQILPTLEM